MLIIQLDTPGGDLITTTKIIQSIRASSVPVVVFVGPNGAIAGSAGAIDHHGRTCVCHGTRNSHRRIQPDQRVGRGTGYHL